MIQTREAPWSTVALFLIVQTILITLLVVSRMELLMPVARATGWIIQVDLIAGGVLLVLVVGGILLRHGGLRFSDVGLIRSHFPHAAIVTAGFWMATQVVLFLASVFHTGNVELHPHWHEPGTLIMITFLVAMLIGVPLYEEVAFRGFLFPQLYLKIGGAHRTRVWIAAIASAVVFSLVHIPTRLLVGQFAGADLLSQLMVLILAGLFGVVMYLRTENLLIVTGIHALVNAPTQIVTAPINAFIVTATLSAVLWVIWPRLVSSSESLQRPASLAIGASGRPNRSGT